LQHPGHRLQDPGRGSARRVRRGSGPQGRGGPERPGHLTQGSAERSRRHLCRRLRHAPAGHTKGVSMAAQRTSFEKLQRDRAKKAKQAAKREKRFEKKDETDEPSDELTELDSAPGTELSAAELLARVEEIHRLFEAKKI